jgi:hypothetical protein
MQESNKDPHLWKQVMGNEMQAARPWIYQANACVDVVNKSKSLLYLSGRVRDLEGQTR